MSDLDKAGMPAKNYEFRAWNPKTRDVIMLEQPELIRYHEGYQLQRRDEHGNWNLFLSASSSEENAHQEDQG